ncbi:9522_t:CDS:2 [Ambispora gerdemannii]|uniref:9522_t:CDS:1 n=1 Tax=Ambispora gerdemannii TaxID=144530 RepID=A0A9N9AGD9_9GLOM|nr:9522_t:CDS:2 [Ambispora gerdemannii]
MDIFQVEEYNKETNSIKAALHFSGSHCGGCRARVTQSFQRPQVHLEAQGRRNTGSRSKKAEGGGINEKPEGADVSKYKAEGPNEEVDMVCQESEGTGGSAANVSLTLISQSQGASPDYHITV